MFAGEDTLISSGSSREPSALLLQATGKDHGAGIECCGGGVGVWWARGRGVVVSKGDGFGGGGGYVGGLRGGRDIGTPRRYVVI